MDKREDVLREALKRNDEDTSRWEKFKEENNTAVENLDKFCKYLTVDVMVPIGQKAYMPGQLIHTNEVLVGHYQGYFSKCSAHKAREICKYRIKTALGSLEKLKAESDLWQNKLDKPYVEGVFPNVNDCEIIEDYDEEKERIWREKHKHLVKKAKAQERWEREQEKTCSDASKTIDENKIFKMLEEVELMEELKNELENLQIENVSSETIRKLMAGDMALPPEKLRQAHIPKNVETQKKNEPVQIPETKTREGLELQGIVKKTDLNLNSIRTNNNNFPNPELIQANNFGDVSSDNDVEEVPKEIQIIKEQAKYLSALDRIGFYEYQIKIMRQKLLTLPLKTQDDIHQKVNILNILETLEELLEIAEDSAEVQEEQILNEAELFPPEDVSEQEIKENQIPIDEKHLKRRISFALQNETLEFRKNETVSEMLPKPQRQEKDIVKLDEEAVKSHTKVNKMPVKVIDRRKNIMNKVEQNFKFTEENQSTQDFKLVDKILESSVGGCHTLHIYFQHSVVPGKEETREHFVSENVPGTPADFYQLYLQSIKNQETKIHKTTTDNIIFTNSYAGEDKVKVPLLKETDRSKAYEDKRMKFCKPAAEAKSILRNKSAVEREQHNSYRKNRSGKKNSKNKALPTDEEECTSAYYKVMNEVVEKPLTEPEPLPDCKYIDAHTPKKRVSRFKQIRDGTEKV